MIKKALFLDRDGVINKDKSYLYKIEEFEFIDGIFELCKYFQKQGYLIIVVTNQSGIARGYYNEDDFKQLTQWMYDEFKANDVEITKVYHCPHHPNYSQKDCNCRKPKPGMLLQAAKEFNIDLANSLLIGDKERDIQAAIAAGVQQSYLYNPSKKRVISSATKIITDFKELWS